MKNNIFRICILCMFFVVQGCGSSDNEILDRDKVFQQENAELQQIFARKEVERVLYLLKKNKNTAINGGLLLVKMALTSAKDIEADVSDLEFRFSAIEKDILHNEIDEISNTRDDELDINFLIRTLKIFELAKNAGIDITDLKKNIHEIERKLFDKKISETLKIPIS